MKIINDMLKNIPIPKMIKVRQNFYAPEIADVPKAVHQSINQAGVLERISPGDQVAIAVGSRGIADISVIVREVVNAVKQAGASRLSCRRWEAMEGRQRKDRKRYSLI